MNGEIRKLEAATTEALSTASAEVYTRSLTDAFEIGMVDGAKGLIDKAVKEPDVDDDILRAYLKGWERGAGKLPDEALEQLHRTGH